MTPEHKISIHIGFQNPWENGRMWSRGTAGMMGMQVPAISKGAGVASVTGMWEASPPGHHHSPVRYKSLSLVNRFL